MRCLLSRNVAAAIEPLAQLSLTTSSSSNTKRTSARSGSSQSTVASVTSASSRGHGGSARCPDSRRPRSGAGAPHRRSASSTAASASGSLGTRDLELLDYAVLGYRSRVVTARATGLVPRRQCSPPNPTVGARRGLRRFMFSTHNHSDVRRFMFSTRNRTAAWRLN